MFKPFPDKAPDDHAERLNDPARLGVLNAAGLMDSFPEEVFDRAVRLATRITGVPVGLLSFVDGERQFFKAQVGLKGSAASESQTPLSHSFCQYVVTTDMPLAVTDAREHPMLKDNLAITDLDVVAYLGVPIHGPDGTTLGSFCAIDGAPKEWSEGDKEALDDISTMIEQELALWRLSEDRSLLIEELRHRTRNLFTLVSGILGMVAREAESTEDLLARVQSRLQALATAQDLIVPVVAAGEQGNPPVELRALLSDLMTPLTGAGNLTLDGPVVTAGPRAATSFALAFHEMTTNAVKYGALSVPDGQLDVRWRTDGDILEIDWTEEGAPKTGATDGAQVPSHEGFGNKLLRVSIEGNLSGRLETNWRSAGLHRRIVVPVQSLLT